MSRIIRNKSVFTIFDGPLEKLRRTNKPLPSIESLRLYRDIIKFSTRITWEDGSGNSWAKIIRKAARAEFEQGREERDPFILSRMLVTSREALNKAHEKMNQTAMDIVQHVDRTRNTTSSKSDQSRL